MRDFRLLTADEIECRIAEIDRSGRWLSLLLYKTARTDAALLDEKYGAGNWQNDYKLIDGQLFCGVGVLCDGKWVWKWNNGTESNTEAEKGRASDAFKRAGFMWGVGTELYSAPRIKIWNDKANIKEYKEKYRCYDRFSVRFIGYDEKQRINALVIVNDSTGEIAYKLGETVSKPDEPEAPKHICADCGKPLRDSKTRDGSLWSADDIAIYAERRYGRKVCDRCMAAAERALNDGN